jgi:hypothetical protein
MAGLAMFAWSMPMPWGALWVLVPVSVATSLLCAWRWGGWGVVAPVLLFVVAMVTEGPYSLWVWWIPVAALTGVWMGLREEGGGPAAGQRAWMLLPVLLFAALLPWMERYPALVTRTEHALSEGDQVLAKGYGLVYRGERLKAKERELRQEADARKPMLPYALPTVLFLWMVALVAAGRGLAARLAQRMRWPELSSGQLGDWRLPDAAIWLLLLALALMAAGWSMGSVSAWTLLINVGLGYCVQGVAVVESLLLARGVPPSIIALTLVFVFAMVPPVFLLATVCVGVSDVWLDYRRLEAVPDGDSS